MKPTHSPRFAWLRDVAVLALILIARGSLADHYHVPSGSMEPTLHVGDHVLVDKLAYGLRVPLTRTFLSSQPPQRGDVVVFSSPRDDVVMIKRLVGLPGDRLAFEGGRLFVNGAEQPQALDDTQASEDLTGVSHPLHPRSPPGPDLAPLTVPPGQYFMMGDHRGNSADSRMWGLVSHQRLLGKATWVVYSPRALPFAERWAIPLTRFDRRLWVE